MKFTRGPSYQKWVSYLLNNSLPFANVYPTIQRFEIWRTPLTKAVDVLVKSYVFAERMQLTNGFPEQETNNFQN